MFQKLKAKFFEFFSKPKLSHEERVAKLKADFKASFKESLRLALIMFVGVLLLCAYTFIGIFVIRFLIPLSVMTLYYSVVHLFTSDIMVLTYYVIPAVFVVIVYSIIFIICIYKFTKWVYSKKWFKRCKNE